MSAAGRRSRGTDPKAGFRRPGGGNEPGGGVPAVMLKQARKSGQLNLSSRNLSEVPPTVWRINIDVPEESKTVSLDNTEDRWWEQVDLTKLILASNILTELSEDISQLPALTVLDLHDNHLKSLPDSLGTLVNMTKLILSHNQLASLPSCVWSLRQLQTLHISHNSLSELDERIAQLGNLEDLELSQNQLQRLPSSIGHLYHVMKLNISNNKLLELPQEIAGMSALRYLDVCYNQLTNLPGALGHLSNLEQLYARHNRIACLPVLKQCSHLKELYVGNNTIMGVTAEHLENLQSVSVLELRDNRLCKLPDEITLLDQLERLDITNNDISTLPYTMGSMAKLKFVVLDGNPMKGIRRDIIMRGTNELKKYLSSRLEEPVNQTASSNVKSTGGSSGVIGAGGDQVDAHQVLASKALDFSGKKVSEIPDDIGQIMDGSSISVVDFSKNILSQWPQRLQAVKDTLVDINLGFNKMASIPPEIGSFHKIVRIELRNNMITTLPTELASLKSLRELGIACNRFAVIPSVVYELASLEILLASDNQISSIDAEGIRKMKQLATLDLQNNSIAQVPPELGSCTQLRSIQLEGNLFRQPRPAILTKGTVAILEYLRSRITT